MAGFTMFCPKPPKVILQTPIAKIAPITTIHNGKLEGRLNAKISPVTMADPSLTVVWTLKMNFWIRNSTATQATTDVRMTDNAATPKNQSEVAKTGTSAMATPYMLRLTESPEWTWGEGAMVNLFIYLLLLCFT